STLRSVLAPSTLDSVRDSLTSLRILGARQLLIWIRPVSIIIRLSASNRSTEAIRKSILLNNQIFISGGALEAVRHHVCFGHMDRENARLGVHRGKRVGLGRAWVGG